MRQAVSGALACWLLAGTALLAADFWEEKDFTSWSDKEVRKMLTDSPWAKRANIVMGGLRGEESSGYHVGPDPFGFGGTGVHSLPGEADTQQFAGIRRATVTVLWINALPVRQAVVRAVVGRDAPIPPDGREYLVEEDPFYTVAVVGLPPPFALLSRMLDAVKAETMLKRRDRPPVAPERIVLERDDDQSIRALFHFPRTEAITPAERDVEFVTKLGPVTDIKKKFRLRDMRFGGRLAL